VQASGQGFTLRMKLFHLLSGEFFSPLSLDREEYILEESLSRFQDGNRFTLGFAFHFLSNCPDKTISLNNRCAFLIDIFKPDGHNDQILRIFTSLHKND
jgi:hypothetical protein